MGNSIDIRKIFVKLEDQNSLHLFLYFFQKINKYIKKVFLQRILQEIMKKNITWNIRKIKKAKFFFKGHRQGYSYRWFRIFQTLRYQGIVKAFTSAIPCYQTLWKGNLMLWNFAFFGLRSRIQLLALTAGFYASVTI